MATGVAAADIELADALFQQACIDLLNGERLLHEEGCAALALSQFQQSCEKSLKAAVLLWSGRALYGDTVAPSHRVWSNDLQDGRLTKERHRVEAILNVSAPKGTEDVAELESLAPVKGWTHPNVEYPWVGPVGEIKVPAVHWGREPNKVQRCNTLVRGIVIRVASENSRFSKTWSSVKAWLKPDRGS